MTAHSLLSLPPVYILGLGIPQKTQTVQKDTPRPVSPAQHPLLDAADVLIGGSRHLAVLHGYAAEKLLVGSNLSALYTAIKANRQAGKRQVAVCSGDPLFFGLGARLSEQLGSEAVRIVPATSSLQAAAAFLALPWEKVATVSLHGRADMLPLAHALLRREAVFLLTDTVHTPKTVAAWMLERGCNNYRMHVLDNLYMNATGEVRAERTACLDIATAAEKEAQAWTFSWPLRRVLWLEPRGERKAWPFGLDDACLARAGELFTKCPTRAAGLAALGIEPWHTVWDLGAGSGATCLEAARLAWRGQVVAVEKNSRRTELIRKNRRRYGATNLHIFEGLVPEVLEDQAYPLPCPHRIFLGGGLGGDPAKARHSLSLAWKALASGGRLLVHCVLLSSLELARSTLEKLGGTVSVTCLHASRSSPLAGSIRLEALNPVFLVLSEKPG